MQVIFAQDECNCNFIKRFQHRSTSEECYCQYFTESKFLSTLHRVEIADCMVNIDLGTTACRRLMTGEHSKVEMRTYSLKRLSVRP
eukprot:6213678-Pleurochrysis_carterae.AAC.2